MADRICELLTMVYVSSADNFRAAASKRGITVEQLAASAIAEMIRETKGNQ